MPAAPDFALLSGRVACITGSSSGIGRAIALELARGGADVIVHCGKNLDRAQLVAEQIRGLDRAAHVLQADLPEANAAELVQQAWGLWGRIDVWVNNAGADVLTGPPRTLPFDQKLMRLWHVDVAACIALSRAVGSRMKAAGRGVILNIGWDQAHAGMEGDSGELFSATKSAVMGFTRSLALSLAPEVRVNCIAPGWIKTSWGEQAGPAWQQRVLRETPLRRWGQPEDVAKLARFLASDEAAYITGQVINANGGAVR